MSGREVNKAKSCHTSKPNSSGENKTGGKAAHQ